MDVKHSAVLFKVKHFNVGYTFGSFGVFKGSFEEGKLVSFTVDANSVNTYSKKQDDHLRSSDFF